MTALKRFGTGMYPVVLPRRKMSSVPTFTKISIVDIVCTRNMYV